MLANLFDRRNSDMTSINSFKKPNFYQGVGKTLTNLISFIISTNIATFAGALPTCNKFDLSTRKPNWLIYFSPRKLIAG